MVSGAHSSLPGAGTHSSTVRSAVLSVVGLVVYVVALVAGYFALPALDLRLATTWEAVVLFLLALSGVSVVYVAQLRRVRSARRPLLRAATLVVVFAATYVVVFAYVYLVLETRSPGELPGLVTHMDGLYFTVTMLTTVGFGDISPMGQPARAVATAQMVFNLLFLGVLVRTAVTVGRDEMTRRRNAGDTTTGAESDAASDASDAASDGG